ncbi:hypothetical protein [Couchioplanes azureus]|uniref:hypothetical protein n=1 Tax=Couchioplanes caeruleus TaxID=56438 RepID=UPI00166FE834|nr:hypothetical protein [Couchioplanes caeruleus]
MATVAVPGVLGAVRSQPSQQAATAVAAEDRYGAVYYDSSARRWAVLSNATNRSCGLTAVACSSRTGVLTVAFTPLATVGTYMVDEDDAYAGRFAAGAVAGTHSMAITFRAPVRAVGGGVYRGRLRRVLPRHVSDVLTQVRAIAGPVITRTWSTCTAPPVSPGQLARVIS